MTEEEKDLICNAVMSGNIFKLNGAIKNINKKIAKRVLGEKNENKIN